MKYFVLFCILAHHVNFNMAKDVVEAVNQFNTDVYQNCIAETSENVIISPFSIQAALTMAMMGAREQTAEEMRSVMRYESIPHESIADQYHLLLTDFNNSTSVKIANKIYIQQEYTIKKSFQDIAVEKFFSDVENVNFVDREVSVGKINRWIESKTNNKIRNVLEPSMVNDYTRMILVNAIHFKGSWKHQFNLRYTENGDFWVTQTQNVQVDMMKQRKNHKYGEFSELSAKVIDLAYENSDISMLIILPNDRNGLADLEGKLNTVHFDDLLKNMWVHQVELSLPKFKVNYGVQLQNILTKMGMSQMFTTAANFSGMLNSPEPLKISSVIHKAFIEVNEEGAEATATTVVRVSHWRSARIEFPSAQFIADHPFIYMIHDRHSVLFIGRFVKP